MGIHGLLPLLKDIQTHRHIADYKGLTLGIDSYVWLHKGAYGCAKELVLGEKTDKYIKYAIARLRMLQHYGIKPYVVFDGDRLPSKAGTEEERETRRNENLAKALNAHKAGHAGAHDLFAKCVDITPQMAFQLIKFLRKEGIPYIVAPYEADAQLAYLEKEGIIEGIITEDSDLLVFGCQRVLFKLDVDGTVVEILQSRFASNKTVALAGWSISEFRQMAILSGCDYLPSIAGLGLKNAHRLLRKYKTPDRVVQQVRFEGKLGAVPTDYLQQFRRAELTFVHQRVWDPRARRITMLHPVPPRALNEAAQINFIGPVIDDEQGALIAAGDLCPITRQPMVDIYPECSRSKNPAIAAASGNGSDSNGSFYAFKKKEKALPQISGQQSIASFFGGGGNSSSKGKEKQNGQEEHSAESASTLLKREAIKAVQVQRTELDAVADMMATKKSKFFTPAAGSRSCSGHGRKRQPENAEGRKIAADEKGGEKDLGNANFDDFDYWDHHHAWKAQAGTLHKRSSPDKPHAIESSPAPTASIHLGSMSMASVNCDDGNGDEDVAFFTHAHARRHSDVGSDAAVTPSSFRTRAFSSEGLISSPAASPAKDKHHDRGDSVASAHGATASPGFALSDEEDGGSSSSIASPTASMRAVHSRSNSSALPFRCDAPVSDHRDTERKAAASSELASHSHMSLMQVSSPPPLENAAHRHENENRKDKGMAADEVDGTPSPARLSKYIAGSIFARFAHQPTPHARPSVGGVGFAQSVSAPTILQGAQRTAAPASKRRRLDVPSPDGAGVWCAKQITREGEDEDIFANLEAEGSAGVMMAHAGMGTITSGPSQLAAGGGGGKRGKLTRRSLSSRSAAESGRAAAGEMSASSILAKFRNPSM
ncbi:hypothetical protein K437DRAFT_293160 [Tilletiaria anomala UBC 951]|uniref:Uncharacterized protein n=1 Tax=Tilletiaria anomala (strain ATCC 24038 / CBS 436.72 / UBC 951) TaxID=1037660 RepID=A0A066WI63_TILAU|nr:uncharacterized protein K437DRAFT_293160 [Tilletiaria anomala UBC 951]KDN52223.1 hypothetical protein K437DRAFT_293160 [Tilletiaria anomala UBC 951]